ncbi:MAG: hypothetical protein ING19_02690 [Azospirillum sp.]|nr:hypothetical protein [Azospirillum sp.]
MKHLIICVLPFLFLSACAAPAQDRSPPQSTSSTSQSDRNSETMAAAARTLQFAVPGNRAHILEKTDTVPSDVAIVYGYADNRVACEDIARVLTASGRVGAFRCYPVR